MYSTKKTCSTRYVDSKLTSKVTLVIIRYIHPPHHGHTSQYMYHGHEWMTRILFQFLTLTLKLPRSRSWVRSKGKVIQSVHYPINSLPFHFTSIRATIPEIQLFQCTWKTFMIHETFVWWALYILFKFVKSLIRHLGLAIRNVRCVRWFSWTLVFLNLTLKHPRSRSWVTSKVKVTYHTQYPTDAFPFLFHINWTNHSSDMAIIMFNLEKAHPKFFKENLLK